jgi:O-antigen ligase
MPAPLVNAAGSARVGWVRLSAGATALMLIAPFLLPVHRYPVQSFYQEWLAMALGSTAFIALGAASRQQRIEAPRVVLLPLGLCVLLVIQIAAGRLAYWQEGVLGGLYMLWAGAVATLGYGLRRRIGWSAFAALVSWVLFLGALATALLAALQLAGWSAGDWVMPLASTRVYGNLGQPNHFADYVSLGLISIVYLTVTARLPKAAAAAAVVFFLAILTFSASRAVWIYLAAAVLLAWYSHIRMAGPQSRAALSWMLGAAAAMVLLQVAAYVASANWAHIGETVGTRVLRETTGVAARLRHVEATWMMLRDAPLLGIGFGSYAWHLFALAPELPPNPDLGVVDHAHNIVLQILSEFGLPGAVVGLAVCWLWLEAQRTSRWDIERWWVVALLATVAAHSFLEYPLWYAYFLGVFALALGASDERAWRFASPSLDRTAFAAAVALAVWTLTTVLVDYRRLEGLARAASESLAVAEERRAIAVTLHRSSLFTPLVEFGLSRAIPLEPHALSDKITVNGRAMRYLPAADMVFRQAALLALAGRNQEAFRMWDAGVAAYPSQAGAVAARLRVIARDSQPGLGPLVEYAASRKPPE